MKRGWGAAAAGGAVASYRPPPAEAFGTGGPEGLVSRGVVRCLRGSKGRPEPGVEVGCGGFRLGRRSAATLDVCRALLADLPSYGVCSGSTRSRGGTPRESPPGIRFIPQMLFRSIGKL